MAIGLIMCNSSGIVAEAAVVVLFVTLSAATAATGSGTNMSERHNKDVLGETIASCERCYERSGCVKQCTHTAIKVTKYCIRGRDLRTR